MKRIQISIPSVMERTLPIMQSTNRMACMIIFLQPREIFILSGTELKNLPKVIICLAFVSQSIMEFYNFSLMSPSATREYVWRFGTDMWRNVWLDAPQMLRKSLYWLQRGSKFS
uniref:Uncharacterized protein MANES_12G077600 n=1 Tax=Rhizophora mucronata TaxID=61149 RepID=A0A2P2M6V5_RHIMU